MDTTEEDGESQVLYPEPVTRPFGVKSPTSELARLELRRSHNVQLMKASLYAEADAEDDVSVATTGDQLVPQPPSLYSTPAVPTTKSVPSTDDFVIAPIPTSEAAPMKPLVVRPHTVVLRYHRKVPPFHQTIAGRLQASCIADMSVSRARHSRAGFGPAGALVHVTTRDSASGLPPVSELSELERYLRGRNCDDWSEQVVSRIAICGRGGGGSTDTKYKDVLSAHLKALLEHSEHSQSPGAECPRLVLPARPKSRLAALRSHVGVAKRLADDCARSFGVSGAYCYEVWRLCDALWGADLENDGVAGTDVQSTVNRYRQFVKWLTSAVAADTDEELARPRPPEAEDDTDNHSGRVLTLLAGGRLMEACRAARDAGDLNMAAIIAQAGGDETVRSLIARQLSLWRECGANPLIAGSKLKTLRVLAGRVESADLIDLDWLRAMNVHARYLCPQVPTLAKIVCSYNSSFCARVDDADAVADDDVDLSVVREQGYTGMRYPTPTYARNAEMAYDVATATRRVLDLRYELIRARATDSRPKLDPATYTPDPLDYSLSFLLGVWFGCLDYASPSGLAQQLEAAGLWHLAVQVLMYHPEDKARAHLVRSMLSRHAPARADTHELEARMRFLREELRVPEQWIRLAQAHRAKYERLPAVEADHLAAAGRWNAAHEVLMEELFPTTVLADDLASIAELLERMHDAAQRHHVSGWGTGGEALYQYLRVYNEVSYTSTPAPRVRERPAADGRDNCSQITSNNFIIQGLVSPNETQQQQQQNSEELHARLEGIRPRLAAACRALAGVTPTNIRQAAARASLGSRLLQLSVAAGEQSRCIAGLLATLALPPDCSVRAQRKVTEELAAEASEGCADSSPNSPVSSRRHVVTRI
ncbi:Nuclear pore complex protein Nup98-Nup96 [Eumeta japonica]|uniref:Nuclear pore complex protein Nup98-Nup96 n=1 Tax=Eumeta variegata TaxID=151549 RepID=A0A4C1VT02_EUMVA|nr:Nuclear pore complex protein Nup98-Nup96 [Eumeta japonica]